MHIEATVNVGGDYDDDYDKRNSFNGNGLEQELWATVVLV